MKRSVVETAFIQRILEVVHPEFSERFGETGSMGCQEAGFLFQALMASCFKAIGAQCAGALYTRTEYITEATSYHVGSNKIGYIRAFAVVVQGAVEVFCIYGEAKVIAG